MTQIKKITDKQGNVIYLRTHTKAVVDDNGYTVESRLQAMQDEINQAQLEVGAVPSDLTPTEGSSNWVTSGGLYNQLNVGDTNIEIDLTQYDIVAAFPNPSKWVVNYQEYKGIFVPITPKNRYRITGNTERNTFYAFLTTNSYSANADVSYATGSNRTIVKPNTYTIVEAPFNAKFLYLAVYTTGDATPQKVEVYNKKSVVEVLGDVDTIPVKNSKKLVESGGVYDSLPKNITTIFENTPNTIWQTGNLEKTRINSNYANKYLLIKLPENRHEIRIRKGESSFNLAVWLTNSSTTTGTFTPYLTIYANNVKESVLETTGYSYLALCLWDKPTDEQAKAESLIVTDTEMIKSVPVSHDYFDTDASHLASMSLVSPMATDLYIEKLTTDNGGILWEQGGINNSTGADESNTKAIRTQPIYLKGDLDAEVNLGSITSETGRICVYDENGIYKQWLAKLSTILYPNGYIRFVFYGSPVILPEKGAESGAYVIRRKQIAQRLENIESKVGIVYNNPVLRVDFPDPTIWDGEDGYFYALATGSVTTRTMYRSANLVDWEDTGDLPYANEVAQTILSNLGTYTSYWAPCVYKVKEGQWNMYLTKPYGGIVFLTSKYPTYGYEFVKYTTAPFSDYIDPDVVRERDGKLWMFAGSAGMMHRRQMTDDGLDFAEGSEWVHVAGRPSGESGNTSRVKTFEGEYLYRHKGYWYLFCSSGVYSNNTYAIRVVRSATLDGDFVDKEGNLATDGYAETIMSSNGTLYGPGHNSQIFVDSDGKTWILYHSHWSGMSSSAARPMCLDEVLWDEDGWPYFSGGTPSLSHVAPSVIK